MNIITGRTPGRLKVTQGMMEDLLCDPVMAAQVLLGISLDAFQGARLRYYWWCPTVIDSSGFSSGKTIVDWVYIVLRCILIPDHRAGVIYQTFDTGKRTFWPYFARCRSEIFRAQLGRMDVEGEEDGKSSSRGAACYRYFFKNESMVEMPAPGHVTKSLQQASWRLNTLLWEEWTKSAAMTTESEEVVKQLLTRVSRESWNQNHPIWMNHLTRTATAELGDHPSYQTWKETAKRAKRGNPDVAVISWNYKSYSGRKCHSGKSFREEYRVDRIIAELKAALSPDKFKAEALGIWSQSAKGWYSIVMLESALELGRARQLVPMIAKGENARARYFLGVDSAPAQQDKSDRGTMVALEAISLAVTDSDNEADWALNLMYARVVTGYDAGQWSGLIHEKHRDFGFSGIMMDHGGGGQWIWPELRKTRQVIGEGGTEEEVTPIVTRGDRIASVASFILGLFYRGDGGIKLLWPELGNARGDDVLKDFAETSFKTAIEKGRVAIPPRHSERSKEMMVGWPQERYYASVGLTNLVAQCLNVTVLTAPDGTYLMTRNNARQFACKGKDDLKDAARNAYVAFRIWLAQQLNGWEQGEEDKRGFC